MNRRATVAVIGGGITGLTAAYELAGVADVSVYEAAQRPGGCIAGTDLESALPVTVDVGAEAALARRPETLELARRLGMSIEAPSDAKSAVYSRGKMHPIPGGTVMGVPADPRAAAGVLADDEIRRAGEETIIESAGQRSDVAVGEFVAERLGPAVTDRLVDPLLAGVYSGDSRRLSLRATVGALWPAARDGVPVRDVVKQISEQRASSGGPAFIGLRGGLTALIRALTAGLGDAVHTDSPVTALRRDGSAWSFTVAGEQCRADAVIVATPAYAAAELLSECAFDSARELGAIEFSTSAVVTALVDIGDTPLPGSGFLVPPVETRTVKAATFSSNKWPWIADALDPSTALLRASVGRHGDTAMLDRDDDALAAAAIGDVERLTGRSLPVMASAVTRWDAALPQYGLGHIERIQRARAGIDGLPGLEIAGAAYDGVGVPSCIGTARQSADAILRELRT